MPGLCDLELPTYWALSSAVGVLSHLLLRVSKTHPLPSGYRAVAGATVSSGTKCSACLPQQQCWLQVLPTLWPRHSPWEGMQQAGASQLQFPSWRIPSTCSSVLLHSLAQPSPDGLWAVLGLLKTCHNEMGRPLPGPSWL